MSQVIRQSNLFAGEDFRKVFKSFKDIDFTAYDFDTIKQALIDYIRVHYPEDFNDYIESSEFIALVELLAYLGTSLSFRVDLNSRENIIDTAERRESIVRLARMINYQPKRNIAAKGLFKLTAVRTNQILSDANGSDLNNIGVFWDDPNNPDWFDQFILILNNAFNTTNPFGRPSKTGTIGSISTDLYQLNNILGLEVAYNLNLRVNGETVPVDIVNPDFTDNEAFFERNPDPNEAFNLIYRNDTYGVGSANTGFFVYFKQGQLQKVDYSYEFPTPNRVEEVNIQNINQTDVYIQEINDEGDVLEQWVQVPSLSGNNVIFNSLNFSERNIFEVITDVNDTVKIKYSDGNFGNVPTGIIRAWVRQSINRNLTIRPEDARNLNMVIPYYGTDGNEYNLQLTFSLEQSISNSSPSETSEQVKLRAPQTYYTQDRMVNNEDYNVFPLTYGNTIAKLQSTNRTFAGHSRYIDINDPTGFHKDLIVMGQDGALYKDNEEYRVDVELDSITGSIGEYVINFIQSSLFHKNLKTFYYDDFLGEFPVGEFDLPLAPPGDIPYWSTKPEKYKNDTGSFVDNGDSEIPLNTTEYQYLVAGSIVTFEDTISGELKNVVVNSILNAGLSVGPSDFGPVELSDEVVDGHQAIKALPPFRAALDTTESDDIVAELDFLNNFGLGYDLTNDTWYIIGDTNLNSSGSFSLDNAQDNTNMNLDDSWLVLVNYFAGDAQSPAHYEIIVRGTIYVFESLRNIRFYWDADEITYDSTTGKALMDNINILPQINNDYAGNPLEQTQIWHMSGVFIQEDGFQETAKIEVLPADLDEDGSPDYPLAFDDFVADTDYVIFEIYTDDNNYERARPWVAGWVNILGVPTPAVDITNKTINGIDLVQGDLFLIDDSTVLDYIVSELDGPNGFGGGVSEINDAKEFVNDLDGKSFRLNDLAVGDNTKYQIITTYFDLSATEHPQTEQDPNHYEKNGKSFTLDSNKSEANYKPLYFKWEHFAPADQRVDPSPSNIIDMIILTESYLRDVSIWKEEQGTIDEYPVAPTTEDLRIEYSDLNTYKAVSDHIVFKSGKFKILFGPQAEPELQATFKVVKIPTVVVSDNEIKTKVIQAIDEYFDINNWSYGEKFFFTELAAYIHSKLSKLLSSVVIVPSKEESQFGNLFEITSNTDQLFLSTATVSDVEIVKNYTESNLRV